MSLEISSKLTGASDLLNKLTERTNAVHSAMTKAITKGALMIEADAKINCPVDTGRLRASITHEVIDNANAHYINARVGTNVDYGIHVELGYLRGAQPRKHGVMPWLQPAFAKNIGKIHQMIIEALGVK